jgi:hypothetical protein
MTKPAMDLVRENLLEIAAIALAIDPASGARSKALLIRGRATEALSKLPKVPSKDDFEVWCNKNGIVVGSLDIPLIYDFLLGD